MGSPGLEVFSGVSNAKEPAQPTKWVPASPSTQTLHLCSSPAPTHVLPIPDTPAQTRQDMCKQTCCLTGTHGDGVTGTHTLTVCPVFIDTHEDTQASLSAHPRGAHIRHDGCARKLTCTRMVMNTQRRVTCTCTHTELPACTGTFTRTHPAPLTPSHVLSRAGAWQGVPGSPVCLLSPSTAVGKPGGNFQLQSCS